MNTVINHNEISAAIETFYKGEVMVILETNQHIMTGRQDDGEFYEISIFAKNQHSGKCPGYIGNILFKLSRQDIQELPFMKGARALFKSL